MVGFWSISCAFKLWSPPLPHPPTLDPLPPPAPHFPNRPCREALPAIRECESRSRSALNPWPTWEFPTSRGTLFGGPYNKDPTIWGTILGSPTCAKASQRTQVLEKMAAVHPSPLLFWAVTGNSWLLVLKKRLQQVTGEHWLTSPSCRFDSTYLLRWKSNGLHDARHSHLAVGTLSHRSKSGRIQRFHYR